MAVSKWTDRERVKAELAPCGRGFSVSFILFSVCALLGIITDATNTVLGLESVSWFLLAIGAVLAGILFRIGWAVSWYLNTNK
jgi:hypothetical protein